MTADAKTWTVRETATLRRMDVRNPWELDAQLQAAITVARDAGYDAARLDEPPYVYLAVEGQELPDELLGRIESSLDPSPETSPGAVPSPG